MPTVRVFITAVPIIKLFAWEEGDSGGHVLRETTSRDLCGLICPSRAGERGGEGDCVKEGGEEDGGRETGRRLGLRLAAAADRVRGVSGDPQMSLKEA